MKTVHLMGIGGTGMAALAGLFVEKGWNVRGSDRNVYPPASTELERLKVHVCEGFSPQNLTPAPDLIVVGNVVTRSNPEAQEMLKGTIPYISMPQALRDHFLSEKRRVVVTGTHGKTTTTSLVAWILYQAGMDPGLFVGGIPLNFGQGYRIGSGKPFVLEGDEYDTAFFEKTPKFLHYAPQDVILSSIEFDHADIYRDLKHVEEQFLRLIKILPKDGVLVACGDHEIVRRVCGTRIDGPTEWYSIQSDCDWKAESVRSTASGMNFRVARKDHSSITVNSPLLGWHNVQNVLAAIALANVLGVAPEKAAEGVSTFKGIRRRQELLGEARGIRIYDDFAHHPTAIAETLRAFAPMTKAAGARLWAVFEPRSNTVRRRVFETILPESFALADEVILGPVYQKADALTKDDMLRPEEVAESIRRAGRSSLAASSHEEILEKVDAEAKPGDIIVFMSNGSFGGVPARVLQRLMSNCLS